ncbi:MAG: insulinase family protein [Gemmatimonadetes bacterium]|nr:insulinase family protein [Gemmatimonadota bacterium]
MRYRPLALAALALAVLAPRASAQATAPPLAFDTFSLANGLRFIVHEDHSTPIVAVDVWYDVGSANEVAGRSGFAHLFEHMLFQETENLAAGEFKELIRAAGGTYNGTTNTDRTNYFETVPSNRLNLALWLEAERMARLRVTAENFAREREVVKEERRLRVDNQPYGITILTHDTLSADWPPYKHSVIGTMEDLDAAKPEDVLAFYRQFYVPNNATVVVAGDVTVPQVRELAEQYFGAIPRGLDPEPLPPMPPTPRTAGERRLTLEDKLANLPLYLAGYSIPPHGHRDTYTLELLASLFALGQSSRLYQRMVKEEKAALDVFAGLDSRFGPGRFLFGILPNQGVPIERIEQLVNEEIEKLKSRGITERELRKAKNQLRARVIMGRQNVMAKAEELHHYRSMHGNVMLINGDLQNYEAVTVGDVRQVAQRYLAAPNRTTIIATPAKAAAAASDAGAPSTK